LRLVFVLVLVLAPACLQAESLGSAAKRERERREKNKENGVVSRVIDPEAVRTAGEDTAPDPAPAAGTAAPSVTGPDEAEVNTNREHDYWRRRMRQADAAIRAAQAEYDAAVRLPDKGLLRGVEPNSRVDERGDRVREAKGRLEAARRAKEDLENTARQQGIPPGWLRDDAHAMPERASATPHPDGAYWVAKIQEARAAVQRARKELEEAEKVTALDLMDPQYTLTRDYKVKRAKGKLSAAEQQRDFLENEAARLGIQVK